MKNTNSTNALLSSSLHVSSQLSDSGAGAENSRQQRGIMPQSLFRHAVGESAIAAAWLYIKLVTQTSLHGCNFTFHRASSIWCAKCNKNQNALPHAHSVISWPVPHHIVGNIPQYCVVVPVTHCLRLPVILRPTERNIAPSKYAHNIMGTPTSLFLCDCTAHNFAFISMFYTTWGIGTK